MPPQIDEKGFIVFVLRDLNLFNGVSKRLIFV